MNLLIAIMSETAISLTEHMKSREIGLKFSSVALVSRRIRAAVNMVKHICICLKPNNYCIGGQDGASMEILEGWLKIQDELVNVIKITQEWVLEEPPCAESDNILRN